MIKIDIRPLEKSELYHLHAFPFATMEIHRRRLNLQQMGKLIFLLAWWEDLPVGQALLNWQGGDASGVPPQVRDLPEVSSLFVTQSYRRLGIATRLLKVAEQITFTHGHDQIGLCVAENNMAARKLYARQNYHNSGWQSYLARGTYIDHSGNRRTWEEMRIYLTKDLAPDQLAETVGHTRKVAD